MAPAVRLGSRARLGARALGNVGFGDVPFPGRAVLEALGAVVDVHVGTAVTDAALRSSTVGDDGRVWITGRVAPDDAEDAAVLLDVLGPAAARHGAELVPLGERGEALLVLHGHTDGSVTDSDPFFEDRHPWLRVLPCREPGSGESDTRQATQSATTADTLNALLRDARTALAEHPVNRSRWARPALDFLTTKWSGGGWASRTSSSRPGWPGPPSPARGSTAGSPACSAWTPATWRRSPMPGKTCGRGWRVRTS